MKCTIDIYGHKTNTKGIYRREFGWMENINADDIDNKITEILTDYVAYWLAIPTDKLPKWIERTKKRKHLVFKNKVTNWRYTIKVLI